MSSVCRRAQQSAARASADAPGRPGGKLAWGCLLVFPSGIGFRRVFVFRMLALTFSVWQAPRFRSDYALPSAFPVCPGPGPCRSANLEAPAPAASPCGSGARARAWLHHRVARCRRTRWPSLPGMSWPRPMSIRKPRSTRAGRVMQEVARRARHHRVARCARRTRWPSHSHRPHHRDAGRRRGHERGLFAIRIRLRGRAASAGLRLPAHRHRGRAARSALAARCCEGCRQLRDAGAYDPALEIMTPEKSSIGLGRR